MPGAGIKAIQALSGLALEQLPERTRQAIRASQAQAEILIACVQLAIVLAFALLYGLAPQATMLSEPHFTPLPWVLGAYAGVTAVRLALAYARALGKLLLSLSVIIDIGLLMVLIWGFHLQYGQPPAFYLKVPTLFTAFIFIALRALRFEVRYIALAGPSAAVGWACLVAYAVVTTPGDVVMRDFVGYMTGNRILIGAEVEKILRSSTRTWRCRRSKACANRCASCARRRSTRRRRGGDGFAWMASALGVPNRVQRAWKTGARPRPEVIFGPRDGRISAFGLFHVSDVGGAVRTG
jgi:hypothetical protein